jgi:hypothetical protein
VIDHEHLCRDPVVGFRDLVQGLGLEWSAEAETFVRESDVPGQGYELHRVASQQPGKWRARLDRDEARRIARVLSRFPIAERYPDLAATAE